MRRLTIQLCTYNRAHLLGRVLEACFDQTVPDDGYEVVLVDDGSSDGTREVIERVRPLARCRFEVVHQPNGGLANARNTGIARATGARILFTDDDVLPTPALVAGHLRAQERHGDVVVRGAVINVESFDDLPVPVWSPKNYSGNWFWTSNVSVSRARLDRAGGRFDESFSEYGWEDIELGLRLRALGTKAVFARDAVAFHHKPRPAATNVAGMERQARAQARTARRLEALHPSWRVALATGDTPPQRALGALVGAAAVRRALERVVGDRETARRLSLPAFAAAQLLRAGAYYDELTRTSGAP